MFKLFVVEDFESISDNEIKQLLHLLPIERQERIKRYRREIDKKASLVTWLMMRYMLKIYFDISEPDIRYNSHGKPIIKGDDSVYFNISHCQSGCLCGVSTSPIGVDIQDIREYRQDVAEYVCCKEELNLLAEATKPAEAFTRIWTIKESFLKMTGEGIGSGLKQINTQTISQKIYCTKKGNMFITAVCGEQLEGLETCII